MSADTEIDTAGTVHAETSNVDISEHVSRDGDGELRFEVNNVDESVSIETRFDDGETRVATLATLSESETDQLADALGVERDVTVERGRPVEVLSWQAGLLGVVVGSVVGIEAYRQFPGVVGSGLGVAVALVGCMVAVALIGGMNHADVLGGGR